MSLYSTICPGCGTGVLPSVFGCTTYQSEFHFTTVTPLRGPAKLVHKAREGRNEDWVIDIIVFCFGDLILHVNIEVGVAIPGD
jgi:hypothetical protein